MDRSTPPQTQRIISPGAVSIHGELRETPRTSSSRRLCGGTRTRPSCPPSGDVKPHGLCWLKSTASRDSNFGGEPAQLQLSFLLLFSSNPLDCHCALFPLRRQCPSMLGREGYC
ncbi:hypothetical protein BDQ94DRAFT_27413 [Aspergillus welwitschiae]|uniref:Uncharacterized protein n=1 Tax=Aspergillus welwitschiae TaxID=1341132 RepID=A0A3F3Q4E4_9EURO|nr:hypothetical protein BDQ94DRAFT_27413 [Aspergillus welwitschiae]RDH33907.1 hypothetical protein BDQ94DRAFT_27413 [Aspergillus welwitschiae]